MDTGYIDNMTRLVKDDLVSTIQAGDRVSVASSLFSMYAYRALQEQLEKIDEFRFIFTSKAFTEGETPKEQREFYIPRLAREQGLYGTELEIRLRNELTQKRVAVECADWIRRKKVHFMSFNEDGGLPPFLAVDNPNHAQGYMPFNEFSTMQLGVSKHVTSSSLFTGVMKQNDMQTRDLLKLFDQAWNSGQLQDVTQKVIDSISQMYRENPPELVYYMALYRIFSEFLDNIDEDVLPKEGTGYRDSVIWNKLYDFQKDAALAIINKLETYNGCILADSVGLGKTFTALAVIKYFESRNRNVLVLCLKKLKDNWMTFRSNVVNNPLREDRLRYDVLFHTDLNRTWFLQGRLDDRHGYLNWLRTTWGHSAHKGYFSIDKHGHAIDSKLKRGSDESDDISAYDLILKNKERLLSFDESTRFIFSHSALREGWDNPNVFQICTLKHSDNEISKRQEVGRGLRLCVNKDGVRQDLNVLGEGTVHEINLLTVIASESYEQFAEALQKDIRSELRDRPIRVDNAFFSKVSVSTEQLGPGYEGVDPVTFTPEESNTVYLRLYKHDLIDESGKLTDKFTTHGLDEKFVAELPAPLQGKAPAVEIILKSVLENVTGVFVGNALKRKIGRNDLNANFQKKEFQELWKRINHKYAYTVHFDDDELIKKSIKVIDDKLVVSKLSYTVTKGIQRQQASRENLAAGSHFQKEQSGSYTRDLNIDTSNGVKYDLLGEIAQAATITRRCAARILKGIRPDTFRKFRDNPEQFITKVSKLIIGQKAVMIVDHISYDRIEGEYDSTIFANAGGRDETSAIKVNKCVQNWVFPDGDPQKGIEAQFTRNLEASSEVAVYAKLPRGFQIPTPVGNYAPDWAVAFREDSGLKHLFFVAETKGSMNTLELRTVEASKIECAKRLFNDFHLADDVRYEQAVTYEDLLSQVKELQ